MRRLPVYLVLDTSGSMSGEPIEAVKTGMQTLVSELKQDPFALETACPSVITFDSDAKQVSPLTPIGTFVLPSILAMGSTELGRALSLTAKCIGTDVIKTTENAKGDWKPLVFLMTDGHPSSDWAAGLADFRAAKTGMVVACAAGQQADEKILKQITENVVRLDVADGATIKAFFKWVSSSISTGSQKIEHGASEMGSIADLPPPPKEVQLVV